MSKEQSLKDRYVDEIIKYAYLYKREQAKEQIEKQEKQERAKEQGKVIYLNDKLEIIDKKERKENE